MTQKEWLFLILPLAPTLVGLAFTYFQYFNRRGGKKKHVVRRALAWGLGASSALWLVGVAVLFLMSYSNVVEIRVVDVAGEPAEGVQLSVRGTNLISSPSGADGLIRFEIESEITPKQYLVLEVAHPRGWDLLTPPLSGISLQETTRPDSQVLSVIIFNQANAALLNNQNFVLVLAERIVDPPETILILDLDLPLKAKRSAALIEVSRMFGLDPSSVDGAIRAQLSKTPDGSYEQAIYVSYLADIGKAEVAFRGLRELEKKKGLKSEYVYGKILLDVGNYIEAVEVFEGILKGRPGDIQVMQALTTALFLSGKLGEAEKIARNSIALSEDQFGAEDILTARGKLNLAAVLMVQGKLEAARPLLEAALPYLEKNLGENHREVLIAQSNLAVLLWLGGDLKRAGELQSRALAKQEQLWPTEAATFQSLNTMAAILIELGRCEEAIPYAKKSLEGREEYLGEMHPEVESSVNTLAVILQLRRDYDGALALAFRALDISEKTSDGGLNAVLYRTNIARLYQQKGDLDKARKIQEKLLSDHNVTSLDHPFVWNAKHHFAETLRMLGEINAAWELEEEVLLARSRLLGSTHPDTLRTRAAQVRILRDLGDFSSAMAAAKEVLALRRETVGPRHRDTTQTEWDLLQVTMKTGDLNAARKITQQLKWVLEVDEMTLCGAQLDVRDDLPAILEQLEQHSDSG